MASTLTAHHTLLTTLMYTRTGHRLYSLHPSPFLARHATTHATRDERQIVLSTNGSYYQRSAPSRITRERVCLSLPSGALGLPAASSGPPAYRHCPEPQWRNSGSTGEIAARGPVVYPEPAAAPQPRWKRIHCRRSSSSSAIELTPAATPAAAPAAAPTAAAPAAPPLSRRCRSISRAMATSLVMAAARSDGASGAARRRGDGATSAAAGGAAVAAGVAALRSTGSSTSSSAPKLRKAGDVTWLSPPRLRKAGGGGAWSASEALAL